MPQPRRNQRHGGGGNNRRPKRPSAWMESNADANNEATVDDLAHAATFAMMGYMAPPEPSSDTIGSDGVSNAEKNDHSSNQSIQNEDEDIDIPISDDDEDDDDGDNSMDGDADNELARDDQSEGSNESDDFDLADAISKMQRDAVLEEEADDDDDEEEEVGLLNNGKSSSQQQQQQLEAPKTEHEVDAYRTPIHELEKHLQVQLTIDNSQIPKSSSASTAPSSVSETKQQLINNHLKVAGKIKHYMTMDRTVVVESSAHNPHGNVPKNWNDNAPLDEGSLLFIKRPPSEYIPLGRVFEVFGPVSKPLYTIRLPSAPTSPETNITDKKLEGNQRGKKISSQPTEEESTTTSESKTAAKEDIQLDSEKSQVSIPIEVAPDSQVESNAHAAIQVQEMVPEKNGEASEQQEIIEDRALIPKGEETAAPENSENAESNIEEKDEEPKETEQKQPHDPWAPQGEYSKLLLENMSNMEVYYLQDEAKLIDTGKVMQSSGKGCDASNLYDEEVANANEMYYSDDEQEREAKNRRKNKSSSSHQIGNAPHQTSSMNFSAAPLPTGFHHAVPLPPPARTPVMPGFYNPGPPQPYGFHSGPPPPPPPPPPRSYIPSQPPMHPPPSTMGTAGYPMYTNRPTNRGPPPPPPPPGSSAPPPAYQY